MSTFDNEKVVSRFRGVHWNTKVKQWQAEIQVNYKHIDLGCYDSEIEAAQVYDAAARKYHGNRAQLNFKNWGETW